MFVASLNTESDEGNHTIKPFKGQGVGAYDGRGISPVTIRCSVLA
jgi:hypothetical protein